MIIFAKMICVCGDTEGNKSLNAFIHIKFQSINETRGQASVSYESTCAVLRLTEILERVVTMASDWLSDTRKPRMSTSSIAFLPQKNKVSLGR